MNSIILLVFIVFKISFSKLGSSSQSGKTWLRSILVQLPLLAKTFSTVEIIKGEKNPVNYPETGISKNSMSIMNSFINDVFERESELKTIKAFNDKVRPLIETKKEEKSSEVAAKKKIRYRI